MGAFGAVRDGVPVPYTCIGVPYLERAVERESELLTQFDTALAQGQEALRPMRDIVVQRLTDLKAVIALAERDLPQQAADRLAQAQSHEWWIPIALLIDPGSVKRAPHADFGRLAQEHGVISFTNNSESREVVKRFWACSMMLFTDLQKGGFVLSAVHPLQNVLVQLANDRKSGVHEASHAALAAQKRFLRNHTGQTYHEFYSDEMGLATALSRDATVLEMIAETGGDLTQGSQATRHAEEFQQAVSRATRSPDDDHKTAMRDMANDLTVSDFPGLTLDAPVDPMQHSQVLEIHHVSELLSGAYYEIFGGIANAKLVSAGRDPKRQIAAVRAANEEALFLLHRAHLFWAEDGGTIRDWVASILYADRFFSGTAGATTPVHNVIGGKHQKIIRAVFERRGLLEPGSNPLPASIRDLPRTGPHREPFVLSPRKTQGAAISALWNGPFKDYLAPFDNQAQGPTLTVLEDVTSHGVRMVRVGRYVQLIDMEATMERGRLFASMSPQEQENFDIEQFGPITRGGPQHVATFVFDKDGHLVAWDRTGNSTTGVGLSSLSHPPTPLVSQDSADANGL